MEVERWSDKIHSYYLQKATKFIIVPIQGLGLRLELSHFYFQKLKKDIGESQPGPAADKAEIDLFLSAAKVPTIFMSSKSLVHVTLLIRSLFIFSTFGAEPKAKPIKGEDI